MNRLKCLSAIFLLCLALPPLVWAGQPAILSGTVLFTETGGKYTYIQLKQEEKEIWLAASAFEVAVGDRVEYMGGVPMRDFHAKALDRTFEEILFLSNIRKVVDAQAPEGAPAAMPADDLHRNLVPQEPAAPEPATGEMTRNAGELSIAELFARRAELAGQKISVRGKVIKVSNNILGRTWLTLADGTGAAPDNTLRVTTRDEAKIGETLTASGTAKTDIDLGAGYKYKLILEDAALSR
ncbi:MAG: hypothetical protein WC001_13100 [Desulfurivibrionaceae bacterium]